MDKEHNERQMAFILEHQAKFSAWLEKLQERDAEWEARHAQSEVRHAQWEARMKKVDRQIEQLVGFAGTLRDALLGLTHHVERHNQQVKRHDQQIADIDRSLAELAEQGKETDARLATLSIIVERHVSGHQ
jgi:chromosome segregation ATPase